MHSASRWASSVATTPITAARMAGALPADATPRFAPRHSFTHARSVP
jgi:hypothetical protein